MSVSDARGDEKKKARRGGMTYDRNGRVDYPGPGFP